MLVNRREYVETNLEGLGEQEVKVLTEALTFWSRNDAASEGDRITAEAMLVELKAAEPSEPTEPADEMGVLPTGTYMVHSFDSKLNFDGICRVKVYGEECSRGEKHPCHARSSKLV